MKKPSCECIHVRHDSDRIKVFVLVDFFKGREAYHTDQMHDDFVNYCPQCGAPYKEEE